MRYAFLFFLLYGGILMGFSTQVNNNVDLGDCATQESTINDNSFNTVVIDDYIRLESSSNDLLDDDDDDKTKKEYVTIVGNGLRLYSKFDHRNSHGCVMRHSGWWSIMDYCYERLERFNAKFGKIVRFPFKVYDRTLKAILRGLPYVLPLTILACLSFGAFLLFGSKPTKKEEEESVEFNSTEDAIDFLNNDFHQNDDELLSYKDPDEGLTQKQINLFNEIDDLNEEIKQSKGRFLRLFRVAIIAAIFAVVVPSASVGGIAMAIGSDGGIDLFEGKDNKKATYKKRRVLQSIEALKKKVRLASGYEVFPTMTIIGQSHGSWNTHTLRGQNSNKKAKAPKVSLETSGRWNAFVVQALSVINARRKALGLKEFEVKIDDFIFTEFRNGARTEQITKAMLTKGYVPVGPGLFVKLEHEQTAYAEYLLTVCSTAKDMRSYGRSYSTSPVIDWISPKTPVHFVDMSSLGLASDGPSYLTQGLASIKALAFQARFVNAPSDMWTFAKMAFGLCKGLFIQAKIVKNVTTGEAEWVSRDLLDEIERQAELQGLSFFDEDCPVIQYNGTQYQAGFFMDTANMAKGPMKKMAKQMANGKKVTTVEGFNFMAFMIAEQFVGRTSMGWQTIQLIHTSILEKHRIALEGKISTKLEKYLNAPYEKTLYSHMTAKEFRQLKGMTEANIKAISLLKSLSGKSLGRLVFGAGLSGTSDYVLELEGLPQGYSVHNPPKKVVGGYNHDGGKLSRKMMSRYPQQGFESLLYLKVVTATQLGWLYDFIMMNDLSKPLTGNDKCPLNSELMAFWEDMVKQNGGDVYKAKQCLEGIKACLPFVKVGCSIISHYDQFSRLRGDSDGDKNFWSYDVTLVAIVEAIENATKDMKVPRLEIEGSGVKIDNYFDNEAYISLCKDAISGNNVDRYLKVANLLCANNNGQGPVGLIANLSTIPLSRLPWEINDQGKLIWGNKKAEKWFAYLLLMQQTAIDMQKRIYPAPSLIRWTVAKLFKASPSDSDALKAPKSPKDTEGDYMSLAQDETVWSMSTSYSMEINCYEDGFMYNERCLSHWAAWVLNSIIIDVNFLTKKVSINGKSVLLASVASKALAEKGVEDFYKVISDNIDLSLDEVQEKWVMTEDLITWKKGANLQEVVGKPAGGIKWVWNVVIGQYSKLKEKYQLNGESPLQHLANACTNAMHSIAKGGGVTSNYPNQDGSKTTFKLVMTSKDFIRLYSVFAKLTDNKRKDISESEYMQGDLPKSASEMKQMFRAMLDCDFLKDLGGLQGYFEERGKKLPLNRMFNLLFSNQYTWNPNKRKCVVQALYRVLEANICHLAQQGGNRGTTGAIRIINKLIDQKVITNNGFSKECPVGKNKESWDKFLDNNETKIEEINKIWISEANKEFRQAVRRYGLPTILNGGDLGVIVQGKGYPSKSQSAFSNYDAALRFVELVANGNKNQRKLDVAEWIADSVWPLAELCYMLADDAAIRGDFIGESLFDTQQNAVKVSSITAYAEDKILDVIDNQITLRNMITEAIENLFPYSDGIHMRNHLYTIIDAESDLVNLFYYDDEDIQDVLDTVGTHRFQRNLLHKLKPLVGAARAKSYYSKWYDWGCNDGNPNDAKKAGYVAQRTFNSLFNITYLKDDEGYRRDNRGNLMVQSQWLKASIDFTIPEKFSGDLYHTFLCSDFSTAGMYILCQESRAGGKFSVGRWVYFDTLTYTLAMNNSGISAKNKHLFQKIYLMAHMSGSTPLSLGHAFHASHYNNVLKWCDQLTSDGSKISIDFLPNMSGKQLKDMIVASKRFLVSYRFGYETKKGDRIIEVMLPFAFGANNKLASVTDFNKWFLSSKLWMALASVGQMATGEGPDVFKGNLERFRGFWGVDYPTNYKKDLGQSSLGDAEESSSLQVKTVLPWFNQSAIADVDTRKGLRNLHTAFAFKDYERASLQGMPHMANAIRRFIEIFYQDKYGSLDKTKYSVNKAVLGLMGLSSVEYQFDNLREGYKSDFTKPIAKSWNSTAVSGLRDLFGGLGESSGWSVKETWYVGPGREMEKDDLFLLMDAFWPEISGMIENVNLKEILSSGEKVEKNKKKKRRNESSNDSIEIKCN